MKAVAPHAAVAQMLRQRKGRIKCFMTGVESGVETGNLFDMRLQAANDLDSRQVMRLVKRGRAAQAVSTAAEQVRPDDRSR